jgi:hypothetical protein
MKYMLLIHPNRNRLSALTDQETAVLEREYASIAATLGVTDFQRLHSTEAATPSVLKAAACAYRRARRRGR